MCEQVHLLSSNLAERDTKIRELEDNYTEMEIVTASKEEIIESTDVALNTLRILPSDKDELIESQKAIINCLQNDRNNLNSAQSELDKTREMLEESKIELTQCKEEISRNSVLITMDNNKMRLDELDVTT